MRLDAYKNTVEVAKTLPETVVGDLKTYNVRGHIVDMILTDARNDKGLSHNELFHLLLTTGTNEGR